MAGRRSQAKKHFREIVLLFSVPLAIIVAIVSFLYVPRIFANPGYDFVYCSGYSCDNRFLVNPSGQLTIATDSNRYRGSDSNLYYYDVERDATRPIHGDEASRYKLDATSKSPDGYTLKQNSGSSGFLFWSDYSRSWSLSKGIVSQPITLGTDSDNTFIGWVIQNG